MNTSSKDECCHFKKEGRGRPSPSLSCLDCGVIWIHHPYVIPEVVKEPKKISVDAVFLSPNNLEIIKQTLDKGLPVDDILPFREAEVLKLRYGLADGFFYTLQEISSIFKISGERARQIEAAAIKKLQKLLSKENTPMLEKPSEPTLPENTSAPQNVETISSNVNKQGEKTEKMEKLPDRWKKITKQSHEYTDEELLASYLYQTLKTSIVAASKNDLLKLVRANIDENWRLTKEAENRKQSEKRKAQLKKYTDKIFDLLGNDFKDFTEIKLNREGDITGLAPAKIPARQVKTVARRVTDDLLGQITKSQPQVGSRWRSNNWINNPPKMQGCSASIAKRKPVDGSATNGEGKEDASPPQI